MNYLRPLWTFFILIIMEQKWIKTEEMLASLMNEPGIEQQYVHYLGSILRSTHWLVYDVENDIIGDSMNIEFTWFTREEFLTFYNGHWWLREH